MATSDGQIVGCVALETFGGVALLRSLAVLEPRRGSGLGGALYEGILNHARYKGLSRLFLLTTTAAPFFARRGFRPVKRFEAPEAMARSEQFASLCPSTAMCMALSLQPYRSSSWAADAAGLSKWYSFARAH